MTSLAPHLFRGRRGTAQGGIDLLAVDAGAVIARVIDAVSGDSVSISSVEIRQPDLEAVFLHLTGKALRD